MPEDFLTRNEYLEFVKRMEENDNRHNKRLEALEEAVKDINKLSNSIERIAINQEHMMIEQSKVNDMLNKQADKIDEFEKLPLEDMRNARRKGIESIVGVVITAIVVALISILAKYI